MVAGERPPTKEELAAWLGAKADGLWAQASDWITESYPGVFTPEWLFGGKKHGWYLRYKKSKSFCSFIPEKNRFLILIVFGTDERAKVDAIRTDLSARVLKCYDEATTHHDGKWLFLEVMSERTLADVQRLLTTKRKPKPMKKP